MFYLNVLTVF